MPGRMDKGESWAFAPKHAIPGRLVSSDAEFT